MPTRRAVPTVATKAARLTRPRRPMEQDPSFIAMGACQSERQLGCQHSIDEAILVSRAVRRWSGIP